MDSAEMVERLKHRIKLYGRCLSEMSSLLMDCKDDAERVEAIVFLMDMVSANLNVEYDDLMTLEFALKKSQKASSSPTP